MISANNRQDGASQTSGSVLIFKPQTCGNRRRGARARYYYPREALEQAYFTVNGHGEKFPARLHLTMLVHEKFHSQLALLLSQLANDGFDVSGPEAEFRAMREVIMTARERIDGLEEWAATWKREWTAPALEYAERKGKD